MIVLADTLAIAVKKRLGRELCHGDGLAAGATASVNMTAMANAVRMEFPSAKLPGVM